MIDEQLSLFANYMKGFNFVPPNSQGQSFKPEFGEQFEGGIKADIFSGILSSTISYYNINVRDKIRKDINNPLLSIQDGTQISKGIDVDLRVTPVYNLNLIAGYGYNESEFTKADANIEGNHPPGTPKHILNFWGSYSLENDFINGLGFGVGVLYSDKYFYNDANTLVIPSYT
ncbi:MAG: TonB-dependent receptor, partial [Ignavibacteriales bacterium]